MKLSNFLIVGLLGATPLAWGHSHTDAKTPPKGFETLKGLVGTWEGTAVMEGKEVPVTSVYKMTSGDSVIIETMGPGTKFEMVNMYHRDGSKLAMTHYCASGTQPHMILQKSDDKTLAFEMEKPMGVSSMKEDHMHGVTLSMADKDSLTQEWTNFAGGKKDGTTVFKFHRKK